MVTGQNLLLLCALICMIIESFNWSPVPPDRFRVRNWMALSFAFVLASFLFTAALTIVPK